jgi:hypothetical protein
MCSLNKTSIQRTVLVRGNGDTESIELRSGIQRLFRYTLGPFRSSLFARKRREHAFPLPALAKIAKLCTLFSATSAASNCIAIHENMTLISRAGAGTDAQRSPQIEIERKSESWPFTRDNVQTRGPASKRRSNPAPRENIVERRRRKRLNNWVGV